MVFLIGSCKETSWVWSGAETRIVTVRIAILAQEGIDMNQHPALVCGALLQVLHFRVPLGTVTEYLPDLRHHRLFELYWLLLESAREHYPLRPWTTKEFKFQIRP